MRYCLFLAQMNRTTLLLESILKRRWLTHFLFWFSFVFILSILSSLNSGTLRDHFINYLILLPSQLLAAYTLNYYLIPQLFLNKKYGQFAIWFLCTAYLFVAFARFCNVHIAEPLTRRGSFETETISEILTDPVYLILVYFPAVYLVVFITVVIKSLKVRFEERHRLEALEKEKATTELKFLKAQIHPHFLFNTLNSIYALTLSKSDAAPEIVLKLSELLDYMLYECNVPAVYVEKEVTLIQGYIDLERIRYGKTFDLTFTHTIDDPTAQIAPLILLSFVENAFKHGSSGNPENPKVTIDLVVENGQIHFMVYNTISSQHKEKKPLQGIGNSNVRRQLDLYYPDRYDLEIKESRITYEVRLKIDTTA